MYFQLDDIRFEGLYGPSAVDYREVERLAKTPLLNGRSALLHTGTELTEYKLDLRLHFSFVNVLTAIEALREKKRAQRVCSFLDGTGELIGDCVIMALEFSERKRNPVDGELIEVDVQMVLVEYAPIAANDPARGRAFDDALALAENDITPVRIEPLPGSDAAELMAGIIEANADIRAVELAASLVVTAPPEQQARSMARIVTGTKKVVAQARKGLNLLSRVQSLAAQVPALVAQLQAVAERAEVLRDAAERGDLSGVSAASGSLLDLGNSAFNTTRPLNRLLILRRL